MRVFLKISKLGITQMTLEEDSAPSGTRTHTVAILSRLPLPLGYGGPA